MTGRAFSIFVFGIAVVLVVAVLFRLRGRRGKGERRRRGTWSGPGPGAAGAVYDMLNEDKRRAIELIVEGRAEQTDPEHADDKPTSGRIGSAGSGR